MLDQVEDILPGGFPRFIDNSSLSSFKKCPHHFFRETLQYWKPNLSSEHLRFGAAYASGLEALRKSYYVDHEAIEVAEARAWIAATLVYGPEDSWHEKKNYTTLLACLCHYFEKFSPALDPFEPFVYGGKAMIEFSFCTPLPMAHPVTGEPLLYVGRADSVVREKMTGEVLTEDDKTTSQLGTMWAQNWDMNAQFSGYNWAARLAGIPAVGALTRGICPYSDGRVESQEVISYRAPEEIDEWLDSTLLWIDRMIYDFRAGKWAKNLDSGCTAYGGCSFRDICKNPNPDTWLPVHFHRKVWNPHDRREIIL